MIYKFRCVFEKRDLMRYISHLDLMRLFMRALRRANLPLYITQGFSPHPKISLKKALKLGEESLNEELIIFLKDYVFPSTLKSCLQKQLPKGINLKRVKCEKS